MDIYSFLKSPNQINMDLASRIKEILEVAQNANMDLKREKMIAEEIQETVNNRLGKWL